MNFYEKVEQACKENNITVTELTRQLGISKSNIRNWKKGVIPKMEIRIKIANITKQPVNSLMTAEEIKALKECDNIFH